MKAQLVTLLAACLLPTVLSDDTSVEWCYNLPSCNYMTWPTTIPHHCSGDCQSPINIVTADVQEDPNLTAFNFAGFDDNSTLLQIKNADGKSVKVSLDDIKMSVSGGGLPGLYISTQFHLHWGNGSSSAGSEHTVNGKRYPMELHIVNMKSTLPNMTVALHDPTGLAVLGFFIEATSDSEKPESWKHLTSFLSNISNEGDVLDIMHQITMDSLLEGVDRTKYYRYFGSLTTPSCNEAVVWTVFKDPIKVSQDLINLFSTSVYVNTTTTTQSLITNNFRGVQKLNGRAVTSQPSSATTPYQALSLTAALLYYILCWRTLPTGMHGANSKVWWLHYILQYPECPWTYARILFVDFSSAFNTIIPEMLFSSFSQLTVSPTICHLWYMDSQHWCSSRVSTLPIAVLSLYTNDCTSEDSSVKLLKFADDTTVIRLIQDADESSYQLEVEQLVFWCSQNNLEPWVNRGDPQIFGNYPQKGRAGDVLSAADEEVGLPQELLSQFYTAVIESVLRTVITVWLECSEAVVWTVFKDPVSGSCDLGRMLLSTEVSARLQSCQHLCSKMKAQLVTLLAACLLPTVLSEGSTVEWCYHLPSCNYTTWPTKIPHHCSGDHQSPVNIVTDKVQEDPSLTAFSFTGFNDSSALLYIKNADGKSVTVSLDDSKMSVSGGGLQGHYKSKQFHLHWGNGSSSAGSEHTVNGKRYPMELHIVNTKSTHPNTTVALEDPTGLAVLGFFIEATSDSGKPEMWKNLTSFLLKISRKGDVVDIKNHITMDSLLQGVDRTKYYRYLGSLTTPSCDEAVVWTVFKDPIKVSQDLINLFSTTMHVNTTAQPLITNNFRGVQALKGRVIKSQPSSATTPYQALSLTAALLYYIL
ncbi:uncharacterized protein LOC118808774 [Colossoma macropomum]|uniref:uncharacterized protein LOC118808774 n=1 Tax=Colossoma macropomum TaxID=42526 RepID=UPI001863B699|nr:uncharacterized protein LOC118808774 [Colossoma macropomum]